MIPETAMWIAVGANAGFFAAKFFAFRLKAFAQLPELPKVQLPPPLPVRKSTESLVQSISLPIEKPAQFPAKLPEIERQLPAKVVRPEKAVQLLIKWLQDGKTTGVFAASEIDDFWCIAAEQLNLYHIPETTIRATLQCVPDVFIGRKQLGIEYREVRQRIGKGRATLYRIPDRARSTARVTGSEPANQPPAAPQAGQRLGSDEKSNQVRRAA